MDRKKDSGADFSAELNKLKIHGPQSLYLIWGDEDYLRDRYMEKLRDLCLGEDGADFNYRRLDGASLDLRDLEEAVHTPPFMGERALVELRDYDINSCKDDEQKRFTGIISDLPDGCTLVIFEDIGYVPDGRTSLVRTIKKLGASLEFTAQEQGALTRWIGRRFAEHGKEISRADAEYLMFTSGSLMSQLIPEIEKLAGYVAGDRITRADIDKVAIKLPEARVFELSDKLAERDFEGAADVLTKLLQTRENPIKLVAIIGQQLRRMYSAKVASDSRLPIEQLCELCGVKQGYPANRLVNSVRRVDIDRLAFACELCTEYEYKMKSTSDDDAELLKELVVRLAAGR